MKKKYHLICILLFILIINSCVTIKVKRQVAVDYYNLANEYLKLENYKEAINNFEKSLEYDPASIETILNLIISYQLNEDYDKVEKYILRHYKQVKHDYRKKLIMLLGNNFFYQDNLNKAIKTYNEYLLEYPEDADCYFNLGLSYMKLKDEEKALTYFLEAYKINNNHIPAIYDLAEYYYKIEDYENSLYYFEKLISLDSENPDVYYKIGLIEYHKDEHEKSRTHLQKAIELDEEIPEYYIALAKVYAKGYKNRDKTIENIEEALKNGFEDIKEIRTQPEFKLLEEFNEFKNLLRKYGF